MDNPEQVTTQHHFELMDRLHVLIWMYESIIVGHPAIESEETRTVVEAIGENLQLLYQSVAHTYFTKVEEEEGNLAK